MEYQWFDGTTGNYIDQLSAGIYELTVTNPDNNCLEVFEFEIEKVSYEDGAKVYFKNGGWVIARFSGTEPLLRIFAEMEDKETAERVLQKVKDFLSL